MTQDIIDALRKVAAKFQDKLGDENLMTVAADEIESLRRERDKARREVCWLLAHDRMQQARENKLCVEVLPQDIANEHGWYCFREDGA
jgi:hypothetical protein